MKAGHYKTCYYKLTKNSWRRSGSRNLNGTLLTCNLFGWPEDEEDDDKDLNSELFAAEEAGCVCCEPCEGVEEGLGG